MPNYSCWVKKNTNPVKCNKTSGNILFSEFEDLNENDLEYFNSFTYNYSIVISKQLEEPKHTSFCYMIELLNKENSIIETIGDVLLLEEENSKQIILQYIKSINDMFEPHESSITHTTGDSLQEIKEKSLKCLQ